MSIYETSITNPKKQLEFYKDLSKELQKENEELKKQLETVRKKYKFESKNRDKIWKILMKKETQQKEFIEWLENEIENCKYGEENFADGDDMTYHNENELRKEILSKYKEIIGGKDEI